jgi:formamidopyrimidine-DNA glycosylase
MPELPEVETLKNQLKKAIISRKIKDVFVRTDKMVKVGAGKISNIKIGSKQLSRKFAGILRGKKIINLARRAKYLIIKLSGARQRNYFLLIHLRMSGQLIFLGKAAQKQPLLLSLAKSAVKEHLPSKHSHVEFLFTDHSKLFYNDPRQFGHLRLVNQQQFDKVMAEANLGPEPLTLSLADFKKIIAAHPQKRAKDFLLNQNVIAGIGNIYSDEALFAAKINPLRKMGSLKNAEIALLHISIKKILKRAIAAGGSSIEYFLKTNGSAGKFAEEHLVYGKAKKPCPRCGTKLLSRTIGSRTATFCPKCQP